MSAEAYSENETFNREENTVHSVFETLPVGVMLTDTQGIIQHVNPV
jgi:PAS domain-containing protein